MTVTFIAGTEKGIEIISSTLGDLAGIMGSAVLARQDAKDSGKS